MLGLPEIAIILVVLFLIFGAKKLPDLGKGLGSGMREFKDGITGDEKDKRDELSAGAPPAQAPVDPAAAPVQRPDDAPGDAPRSQR